MEGLYCMIVLPSLVAKLSTATKRGVKNYQKGKKEKPGYRWRVRRQGQKSEIILFTVWGWREGYMIEMNSHSTPRVCTQPNYKVSHASCDAAGAQPARRRNHRRSSAREWKPAATHKAREREKKRLALPTTVHTSHERFCKAKEQRIQSCSFRRSTAQVESSCWEEETAMCTLHWIRPHEKRNFRSSGSDGSL